MGLTALIPARKGSKGIPNKNIIDLFGKPLIYWTIKKAIKADCFDSIIVSTDSQEIAEISLKYGAVVPFLRPENISNDTASRNDVINFFYENINYADEVVYLQPTCPFRSISSIKNFIDFVRIFPQYPSFSVTQITDNSSTILINENEKWKYLNVDFKMNRQDSFEKVYKMDGNFFYINKEFWIKNKNNKYDYMRTKETRIFINKYKNEIENLDIDTIQDLELARSLKMNY